MEFFFNLCKGIGITFLLAGVVLAIAMIPGSDSSRSAPAVLFTADTGGVVWLAVKAFLFAH